MSSEFELLALIDLAGHLMMACHFGKPSVGRLHVVIVYLQGNAYRFHTSRPNEFSIDVLTMRNKVRSKTLDTARRDDSDFCSFNVCTGGKLRATAATGVHDQSSRSHACLATEAAIFIAMQ